MPALTYLNIYSAVLGSRFPAASQLDNAKRWVDSAYQDVWSAVDWTFRRVPRASFAVTSAQPTMPTDFADAIALYDPNGAALTRLSEEEFEYYNTAISGSVFPADQYMVVNRQIYLSATTTGTYSLSYRRRLCHKNTGGSVVAGPMSADTDTPLWDDHHSVLIPRATAIGLQEINDPTWEQAQQEYERQLSRMKVDYQQINPAEQWGRDGWYA